MAGGWLGLTEGKPQGPGMRIWGVACGSASHPDHGVPGKVEFREKSQKNDGGCNGRRLAAYSLMQPAGAGSGRVVLGVTPRNGKNCTPRCGSPTSRRASDFAEDRQGELGP